MEILSPTRILSELRIFEKEFWLYYKTLEKLHPDFEEIKLFLLKSKRVDEKYIKDLDPIEYINTYKEIEEDWKNKSDDAKKQGTEVHEQIRNLFNSGAISTLGIDTSVYSISAQDNFMNTEKGVFNELRLEYPLDDDILLVGVIDCLIRDGNHLTIIDFKTGDRIKLNSQYDMSKHKKKTLKYPMSKYMDVDLTRYQIQVSIYAWLLQKLNPDFIIDSLEIWHIVDLQVKRKYTVDYIKDDIDTLIKWEIRQLKMQKEMNNCKQIIY